MIHPFSNMSQIRKITYRAGLLNPKNLTTVEKIANALDEFGTVLNEANYVQALEALLEQTHIVELLLSSKSPVCSDHSNCLLEWQISTKRSHYKSGSLMDSQPTLCFTTPRFHANYSLSFHTISSFTPHPIMILATP